MFFRWRLPGPKVVCSLVEAVVLPVRVQGAPEPICMGLRPLRGLTICTETYSGDQELQFGSQ